MIIFRPHRAGMDIVEAMKQAKEFKDEEAMKAYIVEAWHDGYGGSEKLFTAEDIVIQEEPEMKDDRVGWEDTRYVGVKRMGEEDYMQKHGVPQCIGMCATKYRK